MIIYLIVRLLDLYSIVLLLRAILSWFVSGMGPGFGRFYSFLVKITDPVVNPCRQLLSRFNTGPFDFSVFLAMIIVELLSRLIAWIW